MFHIRSRSARASRTGRPARPERPTSRSKAALVDPMTWRGPLRTQAKPGALSRSAELRPVGPEPGSLRAGAGRAVEGSGLGGLLGDVVRRAQPLDLGHIDGVLGRQGHLAPLVERRRVGDASPALLEAALRLGPGDVEAHERHRVGGPRRDHALDGGDQMRERAGVGRDGLSRSSADDVGRLAVRGPEGRRSWLQRRGAPGRGGGAGWATPRRCRPGRDGGDARGVVLAQGAQRRSRARVGGTRGPVSWRSPARERAPPFHPGVVGRRGDGGRCSAPLRPLPRAGSPGPRRRRWAAPRCEGRPPRTRRGTFP